MGSFDEHRYVHNVIKLLNDPKPKVILIFVFFNEKRLKLWCWIQS